MNLYEETVSDLDAHGYTVDDIAWVGCDDFRIDVNTFLECAKVTDYDNGYGGVEVPIDLKVILNDGSYLKRNEYDGSEWWDVCVTPKRPEKFVELDRAIPLVGSYDTLDDVIGPWAAKPVVDPRLQSDDEKSGPIDLYDDLYTILDSF